MSKLNIQKFESCGESLKELIAYAKEIDSIATVEPKETIHNYFNDIRRKVDLRKEYLKNEIDKYYANLFESIERAELECINKESENQKLRMKSNIEISKSHLNQLIDYYKSSKSSMTDSNMDHILSSTVKIRTAFDKTLKIGERDLLQNNGYTFEYDDKCQIDKVFGEFSRITPILTSLGSFGDMSQLVDKINQNEKSIYSSSFDVSKILNNEQRVNLLNLCQFSPADIKWRLIYRASDNGFDASDFHSCCDCFENTLTIIKSSNGFIFGGYASKAWNTNDFWISDENSFLFSLCNKQNYPLKLKCTDPKHALFNSPTCGPVFGYNRSTNGFDLCIKSGANMNINSHSNLGVSFSNPLLKYGLDHDKSFLAGSYTFQVLDIEVYCIIN